MNTRGFRARGGRAGAGERRAARNARALRPGAPPYPTSLDLYAELRAVTPPPMHYLLKNLFEEVTFWNLRTKKVDVQPAGNGTSRVTLQVDAQKLKANALGRESRRR